MLFTTQSPVERTMQIVPARRDDSRHIAELFLIASDGLAEYIWRQMATTEDLSQQPLIEIGESRYAREGMEFSYQNCLVTKHGENVVGMMYRYRMTPNEPETDETPDPVLQPYAELEDEGGLCIAGIAVYPQYRYSGYGTRLMRAAREKALNLGISRISLICFEGNAKAMRLYRRIGYREIARRAIAPHPSLPYSDGDAVLMAYDL